MVTIIDAGFRRGYSSEDHLLRDEPLQDMIGRTYRDVSAARRAAKNIVGRISSRYRSVAYLTIEVCGQRQIVDA